MKAINLTTFGISFGVFSSSLLIVSGAHSKGSRDTADSVEMTLPNSHEFVELRRHPKIKPSYRHHRHRHH